MCQEVVSISLLEYQVDTLDVSPLAFHFGAHVNRLYPSHWMQVSC